MAPGLQWSAEFINEYTCRCITQILFELNCHWFGEWKLMTITEPRGQLCKLVIYTPNCEIHWNMQEILW